MNSFTFVIRPWLIRNTNLSPAYGGDGEKWDSKLTVSVHLLAKIFLKSILGTKGLQIPMKALPELSPPATRVAGSCGDGEI